MAEVIDTIQKIKIGNKEYPIDAVSLEGSKAADFQLVSNLVTEVDENSSASQYPSAKYVYDTLVSLRDRLSKI